MKKLNAVIEFADKNFCSYLTEIDGIIGVGKTIEEVKRSLIESVEIMKEECERDGLEMPSAIKGEYEVVFAYDLTTFLEVYGKIITKAGLERITGINQKQLWHYASGKRKPSQATKEKIITAIREFSNSLSSIEFA